MHRRPSLRPPYVGLAIRHKIRRCCPRSPSPMGQRAEDQAAYGDIHNHQDGDPRPSVIHVSSSQPESRTRIPDTHSKHVMQRSRSFSRRTVSATPGQTLLDRSAPERFLHPRRSDAASRCASCSTLVERNVHGPPTIIREHRQHPSIVGRDCTIPCQRNGPASLRNTEPPAAARMPCRRLSDVTVPSHDGQRLADLLLGRLVRLNCTARPLASSRPPAAARAE